jgi:hypothetical protein
LIRGQLVEPPAQVRRLPAAGLRQRYVGVADIDVDRRRSGSLGAIARDVAGALAVADHPQRRDAGVRHSCSVPVDPVAGRA